MALAMLSFGVAMFCAVLLWPFYTFMRWLRGAKDKPAGEASVGTENGEPATPQRHCRSATPRQALTRP